MPFDKAPGWAEIRKLPLAEQEAALRNPETRAKLVGECARAYARKPHHAVGAEPRAADYN